MKKKKIIGIIILIIVWVGIISSINYYDSKARKKIFENKINNTVIDVKINKIGGGKNYITNDGFIIPLPHHDTIEVGDSISKVKNNSIINVYRKKNGASYSFYKSFSISSD